MQPLTLTIKGMSCGHCVARVAKTLGTVDGLEVDSVRIGAAEVRYDPERRSVDEILEAVRDAGYEPTVAA
ncbi:MAG TPA: cation transporter [Gemmatimonadaceae bacterium]|nr:cation transporter [Gemmatimonadaceae bacterium]